MKLSARTLCLLFVLCLLGSVGFCQGVPPPGAQPMGMQQGGVAPMPQLAPMTMNDVMASISVGDLAGLMTRLDDLSNKAMPAAGGGNVKKLIGSLLGDPALAGLPAGSGALVLGFPDGTGVMFVKVAPEMLQKYQDALTTRGTSKATSAEGLLIVSKQDARLETGKAIAAQVKAKYFTGPGEPDLNVVLLMPKVVAKYDAQVLAMIQSIPMLLASAQNQGQGGQQDFAAIQKAARMMEGELRGVYGIAKQMETLELLIKVPATGIYLDITVRPKSGTDLATAMAAVSSESPQALLKMLPAKGAIRVAAAYNNAAFTDLLTKQVTAVMQDMNTPPAEQQALLNAIKEGSMFKGDGAAMDFLIPGKPLLSGSFIAPVKDSAAAMVYLENIEAKLTSSGLMQMYPARMKFTFAKNIRQYKGVAINQMTMDMATSGAPSAQIAAMQKNLGSGKIDMAFVGNLMVGATGGEPIEPLIDAAQTKTNPEAKPLVAMTTFPEPKQAYVDLQLGALFSAMIPSMSSVPGANPAQFTEMAAALSSAPPMTMAAASSAASTRFSLCLPTELIVALSKVRHQPMQPQQQMMPSQPGMAPNPGQPGMAPSAGQPGMAPAAGPKPNPIIWPEGSTQK